MKNIFVITAGRTGSAWLSDFFSVNLNINAIHESLGIDDFGIRMPDIRTMRNFNNFGNNQFVRDFWKRKFNNISDSVYVETNHTLCKCGLIENVLLNDRAILTKFIILKRDTVMQCLSYLNRNDFSNITTIWQWYLHPSYKKKIINPDPFLKFGSIGVPLWYCYEMDARQEYYRQKYSNKIDIISTSLEDVVTKNGARNLLNNLKLNSECLMPPQKNANKQKSSIEAMHKVKSIVDNINFNCEAVVFQAIKEGFSFD